jgi:hypothetical protein
MNETVEDAEVVQTQTKAIATVDKKPTAIATAKSLDELSLTEAAKVLMASGLVRGGEDMGKILTKLSFGRDLGLPAVSSINGIGIGPNASIILSAALMRLLINRSGKYKLRVTKRDIKGSEIEVFERADGDWESCGVPISFTAEDAKRAGLDTKDTYKKYPVDMYYARCLAAAFRTYCPDCAAGTAVYLPEEIDNSGYKTEPVSGEMIVEAETVSTKKKSTSKTKADSSDPLLEDIRERCIKLIDETKADVTALLNYYGKKSLEEFNITQLQNLEENLLKKKRASK